MNIFVDSSHALIRSALVFKLERSYTVTDITRADVVLKDLYGAFLVYPPAPPGLPALALISDLERDTAAVEALRLGYRGYLRPDDSEDKLHQALHALLKGENWAERHVVATLLEHRDLPRLTSRESDVYALVLQGKSNQLIGQELHLSVNTVKVYMSRLLQKMDAGSRQELLAKANLVRRNS